VGHVSKTTPLLGVICHPFDKTWYGLPLYKIWELASVIPWDMDGAPKSINLYTKYEVSMFTHYEDMKGDEKCKKLGWFGGLGVT